MRLSSGHRKWVYWSAVLLFASGALWLVFHYFLRVEGEFGPAPHPLEPWALRVHGGAAMLALVVAGSLLPVHMRRAWHQRRNLVAGLGLASLVLLLTVTGYALYYFGGEELRPVISVLHWAVGLGAPLLLLWHIVSGRALSAATGGAAHTAHVPRADTPRAQNGRAV